MKSSSSKLYVLGVQQSDQDAFVGEVDPASGEELMCRCAPRTGKDGSSASHDEEKEKATSK